MDEEKKDVEPIEVKSTPVKAEPVQKRPLGYWASIVTLIFAAFYLIRAILTIIVGTEAIVNNAKGANPATPIQEIVGEYLLAALGIAGFVLLLIGGLRALKKSKEPSSPFALFALIYFWIGLITAMNAVITLVCFGLGWRNFYDIFAAVAVAVIGMILYQRKDATILENQILFYVASGLASTVSALNFNNSLNSGWYSLYDFSHGLIPLVLYVLAVLSVIFEERQQAK